MPQFLLHEPNPIGGAQSLIHAMQDKRLITIYPRGVFFTGFVPVTGRICCLVTEDGSGYNWIVTLSGGDQYFLDLRVNPAPRLV